MIKTIIEYDAEAFDNHVNAFGKHKKIVDMQTHILRNEGMQTQYIAVIIYKTSVETVLETDSEEKLLAWARKQEDLKLEEEEVRE